jgi:hypothetical protein
VGPRLAEREDRDLDTEADEAAVREVGEQDRAPGEDAKRRGEQRRPPQG